MTASLFLDYNDSNCREGKNRKDPKKRLQLHELSTLTNQVDSELDQWEGTLQSLLAKSGSLSTSNDGDFEKAKAEIDQYHARL